MSRKNLIPQNTSLDAVVSYLKEGSEKAKLIYAFNATGKTRLSKAFSESEDRLDSFEGINILYYNSFTEDLFYWDQVSGEDDGFCLKLRPNKFTDWILKEQGKDGDIIKFFQEYTNKKIDPKFSLDCREVTFSCKYKLDNELDEYDCNIKISKAEESIFIFSIFFVLLEGIGEVLGSPQGEERETSIFDNLKYVFIDDPISSMDENYLIKLAVDLSILINCINKNSSIRFIVTTHDVSFYNVLYNEFGCKKGYILLRNEYEKFSLEERCGDSNRSFSYHLHLRELIEIAIRDEKIDRMCLMFLRNLYERTSSFLGYKRWSNLLPEEAQRSYYARIMNFYSHSNLSKKDSLDLPEDEKRVVKYLFSHIDKHFFRENKDNG